MKRSLISISAAIIFTAASIVTSAVAQDGTKVINGGIINGRAVSMPKPIYPEAAKAAGINGLIAVNVVIDESGSVIFAEADLNDLRERRDVDGTKLDPLPADPSLRAAAEDAARKARFSPTLVSGQGAQVKGKIVYSFVSETTAATATILNPKNVSGGILNGKAISLPRPEYPEAARAVKAQGTVSVHIVINEAGSVISASAVSGHPLLRSAAETAARSATFSQTFLSGQAVKVSGVLTYNFVLPKVEDK